MITLMLHLLRLLLPFFVGGHHQLVLENLALRQQLAVYKLPSTGNIVQLREVGGLHHRYIRQAA